MIKEGWRRFLNWRYAGVVVVTVFLLYFVVLLLNGFSKECSDWSCFNKRLAECKPTYFIGTSKGMIFEYKVLGVSKGKCKVNVKLLQGDLNNRQSRVVEGKEMLCSLPLGVARAPESDISLCHGYLKEALQDLIIQKLNNYIAKNLGRINAQMSEKVSNNSS